MRVKLPHDLPREEVRRRMRAHADEIAGFFPPGLAKVTTSWSSDDRMDIICPFRCNRAGLPARTQLPSSHMYVIFFRHILMPNLPYTR
jgi:hypothetical protein